MWDVVGHKKNINFLQIQLKRNNLSQAYLFFGPASLGKFTIANFFVQSILCDNNRIDSCDSCSSFSKKIHPDFIFIENSGKSIPIATIREIKKQIAFYPSLSSKKVILFENASLLTLESQNALLKTLEEPPHYAILILIAQKENLLPTILSRCNKLYFLPTPFLEIQKALREKGIEEQEANFLAHICFGRYGRVVKTDELIKNWRSGLDTLDNLVKLPLKNKMDYAKKPILSDLGVWTMIFRDALYFKMDPSLIRYYHSNILNQIINIAAKYSIGQLSRILQKLQLSENLMSNTSLNQRLLIENFMLAL